MFLGLFFVTKFYFDKTYLLISLSLTWIPQIIHNFNEKNQISFPIFNILIFTLNKLAVPVKI